MAQADEHSLGTWLADNPMFSFDQYSSSDQLLAVAKEAQRKVVVYPGSDPRDFTGQEILPFHVRDCRPDMFWTSGDPWPFQKTAQYAAQGLFVWGVWAFVDFDWVDPVGVLDHLARAAVVVPTSVWLERKLRTVPGVEPTPPIRLGVNTDSFEPLLDTKDDYGDLITSARLKRAMGMPEDCFLVGMVQMNQIDRKPFEEQLEGFKRFRDSNPDAKARLYLHTHPHSAQGYDIPALLKGMGLERETRIADDYLWLKGVLGYGDASMCRIYNALDVLLQATSGESPGMPILEAQACGTPVVATDFVGIPEHVAGGELVKLSGTYRPIEKPQMIKAVPDADSIASQLELVMNRGRAAYSKKGREFALTRSWDRVCEDWLLMLEEAAGEIDRRTLIPPIAAAGLAPLALPSA